MGFIHAKNLCQKEVITFSSIRKKRRRRWEQLNINLSPFKEDPSSDEEYEKGKKNSILEEPLVHLIISIRNDDFMNEEDDKAE